MFLHSVSAIVDDIFDKLDPSSMITLKSIKQIDLCLYHGTWGQAIRNGKKANA